MPATLSTSVEPERRDSASRIEADTPVAVAARRLVFVQLVALERAADQITGRHSAGTVHALRVAIRRARTILDACASLFPERPRKRCRRELQWLGRLAGPARDGDVVLAALADEYLPELDPVCREDVEPLRSRIARERDDASAALVAGVASSRFAHARRDCRDLLVSLPPDRGSAGASLTLRDLATERLSAALARLLEALRGIDDASPADALHALRLHVKRLRYLVEAFRPLYASAHYATLIRTLKGLQDLLGAHQDVDVHAGIFTAHARRLSRGSARAERRSTSLSALVRLVDERRRALRAELGERLAALDPHVVLPGPDEADLPRAAGL